MSPPGPSFASRDFGKASDWQTHLLLGGRERRIALPLDPAASRSETAAREGTPSQRRSPSRSRPQRSEDGEQGRGERAQAGGRARIRGGQPWYDLPTDATYYFELDALGNVRRLRGGQRFTVGAPALPSDLGGYRYTAFGRTVSTADTPAPTVDGVAFDQPLRWQGRWYNDVAGGLYEFRARVWSPGLGAFLMADEFGYLTPTGTLWSWPGQNPLRWRDPTGMEGEPSVVRGIFMAAGAYLGGTWGFSLGVAAGGGATVGSGGAGVASIPPLAVAGLGLGMAGGAQAGGMAYDLLSSATQALLDGLALAERTGAGKNEPHGDAGRAMEKALEQIAELEKQLAELYRTQGSKAEKDRIVDLIKNLRRAAEKKKTGETHGRRGKGCR